MSNDSILDNLFKNYKVFIDTCTLMHVNRQAVTLLFQTMVSYSQKYGNPLIIPVRVIEELEKNKKIKGVDASENAKSALEILERYKGYYDVKGERYDVHPDSVFLRVFQQHRFRYNLALITQDYGLSVDILNILKQQSIAKCKKTIKVFKMQMDGKLIDFEDYLKQKEAAQAQKNNKRQLNPSNKPKIKHKSFNAFSKVTQVPDTVVPVRSIPGANSSVKLSRGKVYLRKEIARGGEGVIYETDTPYIAKIYKKELLTKRRIEKIKLILSKKLKYNGICFPEDALYNQYGEFVGYLMPRAPGKEIQKCLFVKPLLERNFPKWTKIDLVKLALTILDKIKYLHDHGIIMGDINPLNILVASSTEVYFIDTDSYQIDDFPCPVGTINYTAPEIQKKRFGDFLRTIGNENFAVATLLFMLMLPGKPPYSQQGGEDPISNILKMDFSYPFGELRNGKTPEGPWRFIWSHLSYKIKEAFYETFKKGGKYSTETSRLNVDDWIELFESYKYAIESGYMSGDPMSLTLFPTRFKDTSGVFKTITCIDCGKSFDITNRENELCNKKGIPISKRCPECRRKKPKY
ncbi:protein kinase domain-containing protein [Succinimonas amylolytica]|uniref:protein kinase domain-containing protein n=1 Tax=Succinimonas amylolytica TaxID=83769 RepID=UPI0023A7E4CA